LKAARIHRGGSSLVIDEVEIPEISPNEVLVKVRAAGICHTELHFLDGSIPIPGEALTLGHEIAGEIAEVGRDVKDLKTRDRIIVNNCVPCNHCRQCFEGRDNLCENFQQLGFTLDGGYAEFVRVRSDLCIPIPASLSFEHGAALTCGAAACHHALFDIGQLRAGETILINGMGGVGFSALQIAKDAGTRCIVVDIVDEKLEIARKQFCADETINGKKENVPERVRTLTSGLGVNFLLELVGVPATMKYAVDVLAKRGRMVFVGYSSADFMVSPILMILKEAAVLSSVAYRRSNLVAVRDLAVACKLKPLVVGHYELSRVNDALTQLKTGTAIGRSVVQFD
jgi:alcohol dehydrogenase, propanol-preferring